MKALILLSSLIVFLPSCNSNGVDPDPEKQEEVEKTLHLDRQQQQEERNREVNFIPADNK